MDLDFVYAKDRAPQVERERDREGERVTLSPPPPIHTHARTRTYIHTSLCPAHTYTHTPAGVLLARDVELSKQKLRLKEREEVLRFRP